MTVGDTETKSSKSARVQPSSTQPVVSPDFQTPDPHKLSPINTPRKPTRIVCIGAGASGLLLAYRLQRDFEEGSVEFICLEKNTEVGGTWWENRYPGCACDVPAHTYTYSFHPKHDWSSTFAGSKEIFRYFKDFAEKHDLKKYIKFQHMVDSCRWNPSSGQWELEVYDISTTELATQERTDLRDLNDDVKRRARRVFEKADILINASGVLNIWRLPDIPGLNDFKGKVLHTARWDDDFDLTGKKVGLIGNGSSGLQTLPAIQPVVSHVTTFIRRPTWVMPTQVAVQKQYTETEMSAFKDFPNDHLAYRKEQQTKMSGAFDMFLIKTDMQKLLRASLTEQMKEKLDPLFKKAGDDEKWDGKLIPDFAVGCRRITPGIGYLESLSQPNVSVVFGGISRITEGGCVSASTGQEHNFDVLICATGFDTDYKPRFKVYGQKGRELSDEWSKAGEPRAYFGMGVAGCPNYFLVLGPNSPIGNGPVLCGMEAQIDYILKFIDKYGAEHLHSFTPTSEAVAEFLDWKDAFMKETVWADPCQSWYKSNTIDGKVGALWPGSTLHYMEAIKYPRWEDWSFEYGPPGPLPRLNRFAYLGNGFSQVETDLTADWAYYLTNEDDSEYRSRMKKLRVISSSGTVDRSNVDMGPPV